MARIKIKRKLNNGLKMNENVDVHEELIQAGIESDKKRYENLMKGKVLYHLWLTEQEAKLLSESVKLIPSIAVTIIRKAYKRGDLVLKNG